MNLSVCLSNFIAQGTMVFMIITIPNQVERFKNPYCTEKTMSMLSTTEYLFTNDLW